MTPSITLKLETKQVEMKVLKTKWNIIYDEPIIAMNYGAAKWFTTKVKNNNLIKRLKNENRNR